MTSGIWGPYKDAIFPGFYLHEGGQSATGILLDYIVKSHPAYKEALDNAGKLYVTELVQLNAGLRLKSFVLLNFVFQAYL